MRYAAFLRGINLGGRRVGGKQLCAPFEALGFAQVSSFLASGNVVFDAGDDHGTEARDLERRIEAALQSALGYPVETFLRTATELSEIAARQPFAADVVATSTGKPQVTFLRDEPDAASTAAALAHDTEADRLAVVGREWYWLPSAGISRSALDVRAVERALGRGTTRTTNTVARMRARFMPEGS